MEKRCPTCNRKYVEEDLNYCLADGSFLLTPSELSPNESTPTVNIPDAAKQKGLRSQSGIPTEALSTSNLMDTSKLRPVLITTPVSHTEEAEDEVKKRRIQIFVAVAVLVIGAISISLFFLSGNSSNSTPQQSAPQAIDDISIFTSLTLKFNSEQGMAQVKPIVKNGVVTLKGTVSSMELKARAEEIAKSERGVSSVINLIGVNKYKD